jgi:chromosome segregation ATPase
MSLLKSILGKDKVDELERQLLQAGARLRELADDLWRKDQEVQESLRREKALSDEFTRKSNEIRAALEKSKNEVAAILKEHAAKDVKFSKEAQAQRERIKDLEIRLDGIQNEKSRLAVDLKKVTSLADSRYSELQSSRNSITDLRRQKEILQTTIDQKSESLEILNRDFAQLRNVLFSKELEIRNLQDRVSKISESNTQAEDVREKLVELTDREREVLLAKESLFAESTSLRKREIDLTERERELSEARERLNREESALRSRESTLAEREEALSLIQKNFKSDSNEFAEVQFSEEIPEIKSDEINGSDLHARVINYKDDLIENIRDVEVSVAGWVPKQAGTNWEDVTVDLPPTPGNATKTTILKVANPEVHVLGVDDRNAGGDDDFDVFDGSAEDLDSAEPTEFADEWEIGDIADTSDISENEANIKPLRRKIPRAFSLALMREFGLYETTLTEEEVAEVRQEVKMLISMARLRGFVTYREIYDHVPEQLAGEEMIENVVSILNKIGIPVYEEVPEDVILLIRWLQHGEGYR